MMDGWEYPLVIFGKCLFAKKLRTLQIAFLNLIWDYILLTNHQGDI